MVVFLVGLVKGFLVVVVLFEGSEPEGDPPWVLGVEVFWVVESSLEFTSSVES